MPEELVGPEHRRIRNVDIILSENQELYDRIFDQMTEGTTRMLIGRSKNVMRALVHWFPPEMAEIVDHLTHVPKKAEQVAAESGKPLEHVQRILQTYWQSGVTSTPRAFVEEEGYTASHGFAALTDAAFCDGRGGTYKYFDEDEEREVGLLLSKIYFEEGWLYQWGAEQQPGYLVLVDERQVDDPRTMADWEKGSENIRLVKNVIITRCGCRVRHGAYNNCKWVNEKPAIDVCLQFDRQGYVDRGGATLVSKADALDVLWYGLDAGLVSTARCTAVIPGQAGCICQCCPDCCHLIGPWTRNGVVGSGVHRSNFDPRTDLKKCTCGDCGGDAPCIKACPVPGVRFYHPPTKRDKSDEFIGVDTRRCMGCGLCAGACPEKAIKMVKARNWVPSTPEAREKAGRYEFIDTPPAL